MNRIFVDTNLLVYAEDHDEPLKRDRAKAVWSKLLDSADVPVISTQVLQEYYNTLTRKLRNSAAEAKTKLLAFDSVETVVLTPALIHSAIDLHGSASLSFWDSLIIAAAQSAHCSQLWSEDMQDGRTFGTLQIVNPLARR